MHLSRNHYSWFNKGGWRPRHTAQLPMYRHAEPGDGQLSGRSSTIITSWDHHNSRRTSTVFVCFSVPGSGACWRRKAASNHRSCLGGWSLVKMIIPRSLLFVLRGLLCSASADLPKSVRTHLHAHARAHTHPHNHSLEPALEVRAGTPGGIHL